MSSPVQIPIDDGVVHVQFTARADGDFRIDLPTDELNGRRSGINPHRWNWLRQTHSAEHYVVSAPGEVSGNDGDALITETAGCPISVTTADCAPVVLVAQRGVAVVHAGWRGLLAGIVEATAGRLRLIGGEPVTALLGPCIHPAAYEFGPNELGQLSEIYGSEVESQTGDGSTALDMVVAVEQALQRGQWTASAAVPALDLSNTSCTSDERWFSHRTRGDIGRQATVAWIER